MVKADEIWELESSLESLINIDGDELEQHTPTMDSNSSKQYEHHAHGLRSSNLKGIPRLSPNPPCLALASDIGSTVLDAGTQRQNARA